MQKILKIYRLILKQTKQTQGEFCHFIQLMETKKKNKEKYIAYNMQLVKLRILAEEFLKYKSIHSINLTCSN